MERYPVEQGPMKWDLVVRVGSAAINQHRNRDMCKSSIPKSWVGTKVVKHDPRARQGLGVRTVLGPKHPHHRDRPGERSSRIGPTIVTDSQLFFEETV